MKRFQLQKSRKSLRKSIFIIAGLLLFSCLLALGVFASSINQSVQENILATETQHLHMIHDRVSNQLELLRAHCLSLADVNLPYNLLTELSSTGQLTRSMLGKLLAGYNGYISGVSIEIDGHQWIDNYTPLTRPLGKYSMFILYCQESPIWPYPIEFRTNFPDKANLNEMTFTIDAGQFGWQMLSDKKTGRIEYILTEENIVLFSNINKNLFSPIEELHPGLLDVNVSNDQLTEYGAYYLFISTSDYLGMRTVSLVPKSLFISSYANSYPHLIVLGTGLLIIALVANLFIYIRFYRPISQWVRLLNLYRDKDLQQYEDELHLITNSIHKYVGDIEDRTALFQRMSNIQERQIAVQQHQIRFHFLFNTLESIKNLTVDEMGPGNEIEQSLVQLNSIISESMKMAFIIPVEQEIALTKNYLGLMQTRFPDINVMWDIDESLLNSWVFKLSIQPILENCYKHAFLHQRNDKRIIIRIFSDNGMLIIRVSDNGLGISDEQIEAYREMLLQDSPSDQDEHIGFFNVHSRIRSLYGDLYGLSFVSASHGTTIEIRYPLSCENPELPNKT